MGELNLQDWKMQDWQMTDEVAVVANDGLPIDGRDRKIKIGVNVTKF